MGKYSSKLKYQTGVQCEFQAPLLPSNVSCKKYVITMMAQGPPHDDVPLLYSVPTHGVRSCISCSLVAISESEMAGRVELATLAKTCR